ncbi:hypothetical protein N657DRAFT_107129 [Parathielavia appendiculata]|uniref:Uncharacterized protein n=1 Tax=Parathielavia appendiculata TaxID=2587402 RepID=A0AAN6Z0X3_9PEZI|nr:hypothetical protein N657DRAFT_107129 [Parathielavia appendiculata]
MRPRDLVAARALSAVPPIQQSRTHLSGLVTTKLWAAVWPCSSLSCITRAACLRLQHGVRAWCTFPLLLLGLLRAPSPSSAFLRVFLCSLTLQVNRKPILNRSPKAREPGDYPRCARAIPSTFIM